MEQYVCTFENWWGDRRWRGGVRHIADPQNPIQPERLPLFQDEGFWESLTRQSSILEAKKRTPEIAQRLADLIRNHVPFYHDPTYTKYLPLNEQFWTYSPAEVRGEVQQIPDTRIFITSSKFPLKERDLLGLGFRMEMVFPGYFERILFIRRGEPIIRFLPPFAFRLGIEMPDRIKNNNPKNPDTMVIEKDVYRRKPQEGGYYAWERKANMEDLNIFGRILDLVESPGTKFSTDRYAPPDAPESCLRRQLQE